MKSFFAIPIILVLFISCGSDDKDTEFVDDKNAPTNQKKKEEITPQLPKETVSVELDTPSDKTADDKIVEKRSFENEKPVAVISPLEAEDYNGKTVKVKGFVADVYKSEKVAYLNFVEKYPDNPFTAVIFARKFSDFPDIEKFKLKDVEVIGRVSMFRGKAQIILENPEQVKIIN